MSDESQKVPAGQPFAAAMDQMRTAAEDFTKLFSQMKAPPVFDAAALMAAHRRNVEALSAANRVALEGAQAVARRHFEILQQTATELTETLRQLATADTPQNKAASQAELLKQAYERAVANTKELSELIQRSNAEALGLLNARFTEALDEVKALVATANTPR
jgi:phasin family protein